MEPNASESKEEEDAEDRTEEMLEYMVEIPDESDHKFSLRQLWAFTGPGFLMSIAYLDPGNIESDLQSGANTRYKLLWVLLGAHILGFLLQRMSARLGVVSNRHMAELARDVYPKVPRTLLWLMVEVAIIGSDMQEVIGTAVAIYLLSYGSVPLIFGVLITMVDSLTFLFIDQFGFRKLEGFFALLITVMAVTFGFEFFMVKPDVGPLLKGMFIPYCEDCGMDEFNTAIQVVGAVIMPHNLYLHSALVKSRRIDRSKRALVSQANFYYLVESGVALLCSYVINMFVVGVFAHGLYSRTNMEVRASCDNARHVLDDALFPYDNRTVEADLYRGGVFLECEFGRLALLVWGVGILASGQSSTMTGTYAGQFVMEGFLGIRWPKWQRVLFTRLFAIVPTIVVTLFAQGVQSLTGMNDLLNCVQMVQLPFAMLPVITFVANEKIMFDFKSSRMFEGFTVVTAFVIIGINLYFSAETIFGMFGTHWLVFMAFLPVALLYLAFVLYLIVVLFQTVGLLSRDFIKCKWLRPNFEKYSICAKWDQDNRVNHPISSIYKNKVGDPNASTKDN